MVSISMQGGEVPSVTINLYDTDRLSIFTICYTKQDYGTKVLKGRGSSGQTGEKLILPNRAPSQKYKHSRNTTCFLSLLCNFTEWTKYFILHSWDWYACLSITSAVTRHSVFGSYLIYGEVSCPVYFGYIYVS